MLPHDAFRVVFRSGSNGVNCECLWNSILLVYIRSFPDPNPKKAHHLRPSKRLPVTNTAQ